jgi:hypothetical protein
MIPHISKTNRSMLLVILAFLTATLIGRKAYGNTPDIVECVSKDVWDAGFVLRFDLNSYKPEPNRQILGDLYEIETLWTLTRKYLGPLDMSRVVDETGCHIGLTGQDPSSPSEVTFHISEATPEAEVVQLQGKRPEKFAQLNCNPKLIERLKLYCAD